MTARDRIERNHGPRCRNRRRIAATAPSPASCLQKRWVVALETEFCQTNRCKGIKYYDSLVLESMDFPKSRQNSPKTGQKLIPTSRKIRRWIRGPAPPEITRMSPGAALRWPERDSRNSAATVLGSRRW